MTDIELLKLAAKAANYEFRITCLPSGADVVQIKSGEFFSVWNPFVDGNDALRLAVDTRQQITTPRAFGFGACAEPQDGGSAGVTVFRGHELSSAMSQTCRAIVMCAANMVSGVP